MKKLLLLILTCGLFAGAAYAQDGMQHVMETVTAIRDSSVSVETMHGAVQTVAIMGDTKVLKGDAAITLQDIKVGDYIVLHAAKKEGKLVAAEVKVGAMEGRHADMPGMDMSGSRAPSH